jgi:hypothetical protein
MSKPAQAAGLELAQVRNEQAVKHHLCFSCKSDCALATLHGSRGKSERFSVCKGNANARTGALLALMGGINLTA